MPIINTNDLTGAALDWAVDRAEGKRPSLFVAVDQGRGMPRRYSTDWTLAGPIIEREGIALRRHSSGVWYAMQSKYLGDSEGARWSTKQWVSQTVTRPIRFAGPTLLIAAMRCYVAAKLGDRISAPDALPGA